MLKTFLRQRAVAIPYDELSGESDEQLFERFRDRADRVALAALVERHVDTVAAACARILPPQLAEEAAQETFVQAIRCARGFRQGARFKPWLLGIALNSCRRAARQERQTVSRENPKRNDPLNTSAADVTADAAAIKGEWIELLDACLREFSPDQRAALVLHFGHGLSQAEVATLLKRPKGTVGSWLTNGLEKLRAMMRGHGIDTSDQIVALLLITAPRAISTAALRVGALKSAATIKPLPAVLIKGTLAMKLALASTAAVAAAILIACGPRGFGADFPPSPVPATPAPIVKAAAAVFGTPDAQLAAILNTRVTVNYHNQYLPGVLQDLWGRAKLRSAFAPPFRNEHLYTFILKDNTVREILERVAADGGLQLEFRGNRAVFWKSAPDSAVTTLEKQVHAGDVWQRIGAVQNLGQLGSKRAYMSLFKLVSDPDEAVSHEAVTQLADSADSSLRDGSRSMILRQIDGVDAFVPALLKGVDREKIKTADCGLDTQHRLAILVSLDGPNARQFMRPYIKQPSSFYPLETLALANDESIEAQLQLLLKSGATGRERAMMLMTQRELPRDIETLIGFITGSDRASALLAMYVHESTGCAGQVADTSCDPRIAPAVMKFVNDSDAWTRSRAIEALCKTRDSQALETVYKALFDPDHYVRFAAAIYACNLPNLDSRTIERIADMAASEIDENVRHPAAVGLRMIADDYAAQRLVALLDSPRPEVRADACDLIGPGFDYLTHRVDDPAIVPALRKLVHDTGRPTQVINGKPFSADDQVRYHALTALGFFPGPDVASALKQTVLQPEEQLKNLERDYYATLHRGYSGFDQMYQDNIVYENGLGHENERLQNAKVWGLSARAWINADPAARDTILALPGEHPLLLEMLNEKGDTQVIQRLIALSRSANVDVRRITATSLSRSIQFPNSALDFQPLIPVLTQLAADSDSIVSEMAGRTVLNCAERDFRIDVFALVQSLPDPELKKRLLDHIENALPRVGKQLAIPAQPARAAKAAETSANPSEKLSSDF